MEQEEVSSALASARLALGSNQSEQAVKMLMGLVQSVPDNPDALALLGVAYASRKDYGLALDCFRKSLTLRPSARTHFNLAYLYRIQGFVAPAKRELREALRLDPQHEQASRMLYELENPEQQHAAG